MKRLIMSRLIRISTVCHAVLDFWLRPLFAAMNVSKTINGMKERPFQKPRSKSGTVNTVYFASLWPQLCMCAWNFRHFIWYDLYARVKRKRAFKHAQNVRIHITLHMRKVSSGHLLSIETFCSSQWFCSNGDNLHEMSKSVAQENMKNIINVSSTE